MCATTTTSTARRPLATTAAAKQGFSNNAASAGDAGSGSAVAGRSATKRPAEHAWSTSRACRRRRVQPARHLEAGPIQQEALLEQEGLEEGQPEEEALPYLAEEDSPEQRTLLRRTRRPRALTQLPGGSGPWSPSQRLPHPGLRFNHVLRQSPADRWAPPTTRIGLPCRLHQLRV